MDLEAKATAGVFDMLFVPVTVNDKDIRRCYTFAVQAWEHQSHKHFGGEPRQPRELIADQLEGKLAEIALQKFLAELGIQVTIDFHHYRGEKNTDSGDLQTKTRSLARVDVKGSSFKAQWLLVEDYKFFQIETHALVSDAFVMVCFDPTFPSNKTIRKDPRILLGKRFTATVRGWVYATDFYIPTTSEFWFDLPRGSHLFRNQMLPTHRPDRKDDFTQYLAKRLQWANDNHQSATLDVTLDAKLNYGLPILWLRHDWSEFIALLDR